MKKTNTGVKTPVFYTTFTSLLGTLYIAFTKRGVSRIYLDVDSEKAFVRDIEESLKRAVKRNDRGISAFKRELRYYFSSPEKTGMLSNQRPTNNRNPFSFRSPIDLLEGTHFERKVWLVIKKIPYGKVVSYKGLAIRIGRPEAVRAVGSACKKNPLPILIPCHRVIGKDKSLRGYSSGIDIKRRLLEMEGVNI